MIAGSRCRRPNVERQANRLNRLAEDLLDAARVDSDRLELSRAPTDVGALVQAVLADVDEEQVVADIAPDVEAQVDAPRVERIVWNLVSNALKYGKAPVEVRLRADDTRLRLRVRDHGRGLSDAQLERLFTDFSGGDDPGSVGLGLAIVWQLVTAHGGTVTYEDAGPGAAFTVSLPR